MERKIAVFTENMYLFQKIKLDVPSECVVRLNECKEGDLCLFDIDTSKLSKPSDAIVMSYSDGYGLKLPLALGAVEKLLSEKALSNELLILNSEARCAILHGEEIKLTEVEFLLLNLLYSNGGNFVSREEILHTVWEENTDAGVINVYIHYLREKLEKRGEKIIISSRKCGYKIDEKYVGGRFDAQSG